MRALEIVFPVNLGDLSEAKANAINKAIQKILTPFQENQIENSNKKVDVSLDFNPQTMKVNLRIDEAKSFLETSVSNLVANMAKQVFETLFIENVGVIEVALTIT